MAVPEFSSYGGVDAMNQEQLVFYKMLKNNISKKNFIDVNGNISYLFAYAKELIENLHSRKIDVLHKKLSILSENYNKYQKFSNYAMAWSHDCLLAKNKLDDYLVATEIDPFEKNNFFVDVNIRITICLKLSKGLAVSDSLVLSGFSPSDIVKDNKNLFLECYAETYHQVVEKHGDLLEFLCSEVDAASGDISVFSGTSVAMGVGIKLIDFRNSIETISLIKEIIRVSENKVRIHLGYPKIGEGWVSETILYKKLKEKFSETIVIQHGRPDFLKPQHYDVWFPRWRVAVEYHGMQHFIPVSFFGGEDGFENTKKRDEKKLKLSSKNKVKVIVVREGYDIEKLFKSIENERDKIINEAFLEN